MEIVNAIFGNRLFRRAVVIALAWGLPVTVFDSLQAIARHAPRPHIRTLAEITGPAASYGPSPAGGPATLAAPAPSTPVTGPLPLVLGKTWQGSFEQGRLSASFSDSSWFVPGSAELSASGRTAVAEVARGIRELPSKRGMLQVSVEAHSDSKPVVRLRSKYPTNWELSGARAFAIVRELESLGLERQSLSGTGFADSRPVSNRASLNRRVVISVTTASAAGLTEVARR